MKEGIKNKLKVYVIMELIDKAAVVAEIEKRMKLRYDSYKTYNSLSDFIAWEELEYLKEEFLPTLEVKEVDWDEEVDKRYNNEASKEFENVLYEDIFELGIKVKGE